MSGNNTKSMQGYNIPGTEKTKKNSRKINSGVSNKLLIGRSGTNVVQGNHYVYQIDNGQPDPNRKTQINFL